LKLPIQTGRLGTAIILIFGLQRSPVTTPVFWKRTQNFTPYIFSRWKFDILRHTYSSVLFVKSLALPKSIGNFSGNCCMFLVHTMMSKNISTNLVG